MAPSHHEPNVDTTGPCEKVAVKGAWTPPRTALGWDAGMQLWKAQVTSQTCHSMTEGTLITSFVFELWGLQVC